MTTENKKDSWISKFDKIITNWINSFSDDNDIPSDTSTESPKQTDEYTSKCFVVRYDGEVLESKVRKTSGGNYSVKYNDKWIECYKDGTVSQKYSIIVSWYLP